MVISSVKTPKPPWTKAALLIVANDLGNNASDNGQLLPMLEKVKENLAALPKVVPADSGYASERRCSNWRIGMPPRAWRSDVREKAISASIRSSIPRRLAWPSG